MAFLRGQHTHVRVFLLPKYVLTWEPVRKLLPSFRELPGCGRIQRGRGDKEEPKLAQELHAEKPA